MPIDRGQCLASGANREHIGQARQQRFQLRLYFQHDTRALPRHRDGVARKLQGVAETLLGIEQNGLAAEIAAAEPEGLRHPRDCHAQQSPPFVFLPAGPEVSNA